MNDNNNWNITKDVMTQAKEDFRIQLENTGYYVDMSKNTNKAIFNVIHLNKYDEQADAFAERQINVALTPEAFNGFIQEMPSNRFPLMLMTLAKFVDSDGFCYPSVETIAEVSGLSRSTAFDYLKKYANKKVNGKYYLYKKTIKRGKGLQDLNLYYLPYCESVYADAVGSVESEDSLDFDNEHELDFDNDERFVALDVDRALNII